MRFNDEFKTPNALHFIFAIVELKWQPLGLGHTVPHGLSYLPRISGC